MRVREIAKTAERVCVEVTLEPGEVDGYTSNAYMVLAMRHDLRPEPDKTSRDVVNEHLDPEMVAAHVSKAAVDATWQLALDGMGLHVVGIPNCAYERTVVHGEEFTYTADAVRRPVYELESYDPVELFKQEVEVSDEEVDAFIARETRRFMVAVPDDDPAHDVVQPDSMVRMSMVTKKDGEPYAPLTFDARDYELGVGDMPDGFDGHLVGLHVGASVEFSFEGPDLEGARKGVTLPATFDTKVTITHMLRRELPQIDDEWVAAHVKNATTVEQMRARVREEIEGGKSQEDAEYLKYLAAMQVADRLVGTISDEVFEAAYQLAAFQFQTAMRQQGMTAEQYYKQHDTNAREFAADLMMQTRAQLKQQFALDAFARHLHMDVDDAYMMRYYDLIDPGKAEEVKARVEEAGQLTVTKEAALRMRVNEWLVDNAVEPEDGPEGGLTAADLPADAVIA